MKKNGKVRGDCPLIENYQFIRIMKLSFLLLFISFASLSASVLGQNDIITYSGNSVKVSQVLDFIELNTDFSIAYSSQYINLDREVTVEVKNEKVKFLLEEVFEGTSIAVKVTDDKILLYDKEIQQKEVVTKSISGIVKDDKGEVIPGASILVKGTTIGTITDLDGKFTLTDVPEDAIIVVSFIGMKNEEIAVAGKLAFNVALKSDVIGLDEVVAVGYATVKKINLTGSVGNVKMDEMENRPTTNAGLALQGTVSGVYALQSSGQPGDDDAVINIRGVGNFDDSSPLVLIDGMPGDMTDVNANDIESISVLKDAASASIYGNRAANGVILITTKRGQEGKMQVSYTGYMGVQSATALPDVLNSEQYAMLKNEADANTGSSLTYTEDEIALFAAHTDPLYPDNNYFDIYYDNAVMQNHRLNVTGGKDNVKYAFMVGRLDQDGILIGTNYKKTDFRANIDSYFLKDNKLRFSSNIAGNLGVKTQPTDIWSTKWYATNAPVIPLVDADGNWVAANGERNYYGEVKEGSTEIQKRFNFNGQTELEYTITDGLSAQITYGYNVEDYNYNAFHANVTLYNVSGTTKDLTSDLGVTDGRNIHSMLTGLLKYKKSFGEHDINFLAGYSEEEYTYDWEYGYRSGFVNNTQRVLNLGDASTQTNNAGSYDLGLRSYFGRINYTLKDKYLFEANVRRDGSSRFADGNQWGTFPSFSGGWILSKESFMESVDWLNVLKLRVS